MKERLKELSEKLLSFKFVIFVIATLLCIFRIISGSEWLTVCAMVLAGHVGMKGLHTVLENGPEGEG